MCDFASLSAYWIKQHIKFCVIKLYEKKTTEFMEKKILGLPLSVHVLELTAIFFLIKRWKVSQGKESKELYQDKTIHVAI